MKVVKIEKDAVIRLFGFVAVYNKLRLSQDCPTDICKTCFFRQACESSAYFLNHVK